MHEIEQTQFGALTGWIWLKQYVFIQNPNMRARTIIYSDYIDMLNQNISNEELEGIYLVAKSSENNVKQVLAYVDEIQNKIV